MDNTNFYLLFQIALGIILGYIYGYFVDLFNFLVSLNYVIISIYTSVKRSYIWIIPWGTSQTTLFYLSITHLGLFPGLINNDLSVILNNLVVLSIIFCSIVSLVSNIYWLNPSTLHTQYGSRSQVAIPTSVILALSASVLNNFISLPAYFLCSS